MPHHRWKPGDYVKWDHPSLANSPRPSDRLRQEQIGGTCRDNLQSRPGDIVVHEHWHSSGFANTDPDLQLTQAMHAAPAELVVDLTGGAEARRP